MNGDELSKVEVELRTAAHSLWHFRQKVTPHVEVANYLESAQQALSALRAHLSECRLFLKTKGLL